MGARGLWWSVLLSLAAGAVGHGQSVAAGPAADAAVDASVDAAVDPTVDPTVATALLAARLATDRLSATLVGRLETEMRERGPLAAFEVCAEVAQSLTAAESTAGLVIRRVSLRARNPLDRPSDAERAVLEQLAAAHAQGDLATETWEVVAGELHYYRPIIVREACLRCHGAAVQLQPEVAQRLAARYPEDQAVGYAVGDLRGAVAVRVALPAVPPTAAPP